MYNRTSRPSRPSFGSLHGKRAALVTALILLGLSGLASQAGAALSLNNPPAFEFVNDEGLADDQPGQKDLNSQAVANPAPNDLWVSWKWDDTGLSGGNTGDACALFDTNANSKVNFAICVTIQKNPAEQAPVSPRVYTCGDGKVDRCTSTYAQVSPINSACATNTNASDPFHANKKDTQAICHVDLGDVGGAGTANLVNTCSYPSQQPTSAPSDCVLVPRDAFVTIVKNASPDSGSFPFRLGVTSPADAAQPVVFTASGTETSGFIAIRSDRAYKLKEDVPANWTITGTPSCTGATGSNGTFSGDTITGIQAAPDNSITCTFNNTQLTGAIEITKQRTGTSTVLEGARFTIDGAGPYITGSDGKVCVAGLTLGNHTVTETQAPDGHTVDSTSPKTVNVASAGTCSSGATPTTFDNPLVLGTINIHKTDGAGGALPGATFTLYENNGTKAAPRGADDTATSLTCTTNGSGDCQITGIALGDYWVVETGVPSGYVGASERAVTIVVGPSPGVGDSHSLTFVNAAAPGTINIQKTGFGGAALQGATFTLYYDGGLNSGDPAAVMGIEDESTGQTCTSDAAGVCTFTGVAPGNYWVVETTTPAGYSTVAPTQVAVPFGTTAGQGATVNVPISDPVVNGTVNIKKLGINGTDLNGATFTLYVNNSPLGSRGAEDTVTSKTCTTANNGTCSIGNVTPGNYWVVETGVPNGYDAAPDQAVNVGIGTAANVGDSDSLQFTDPVVDGTVRITKTDDAANLLEGAEFTLYTDATPVGGTRDQTNPDPITNPVKKCTTDANGVCEIAGVAPGKYWVVETGTPSDYSTAADQAITVGLGSAPHVGHTVDVGFVNERRHRVVVLVCHEGTDTLHPSDVTVGNVTKKSLAAGSLTAAQQKALCDTGGASFGGIGGHDSVTPTIALGH